jgi:hypothetical protein
VCNAQQPSTLPKPLSLLLPLLLLLLQQQQLLLLLLLLLLFHTPAWHLLLERPSKQATHCTLPAWHPSDWL